MIYFDSNPKHGAVGFFVGDELECTGSVHDNFAFAKSAARARLAQQLDKVEGMTFEADRLVMLLEELEIMTVDTVPKIDNPFGGG